MIFSDIPFKLGHALFTTESLPEQKWWTILKLMISNHGLCSKWLVDFKKRSRQRTLFSKLKNYIQGYLQKDETVKTTKNFKYNDFKLNKSSVLHLVQYIHYTFPIVVYEFSFFVGNPVSSPLLLKCRFKGLGYKLGIYHVNSHFNLTNLKWYSFYKTWGFLGENALNICKV